MCRKKLSIKHLESFLQDIDGFDAPKLELEQYATPPHIAALVLNAIDSTYDDIEGNLVADLGCGTGRLTVGSIISGAKLVYGFDIDQEALKCGIRNINDLLSEEEASTDTAANAYLNCEKFNFIQADIASSNCDRFWEPWIKMFDTVVMNPPFGTKHNQGIDMIFLKRAVDLSHNSVYSLHKTSTREVSLLFLILTIGNI